jgi:hypothetical protein
LNIKISGYGRSGSIGLNGLVTSNVIEKMGGSPTTLDCLPSVSQGSWLTVKCPDTLKGASGAITTAGESKVAYCHTDKWVWDSSSACPLAALGVSKARSVFKGKKVVFMGDSVVRNVYYQFNIMLDPSQKTNGTGTLSSKHSNLKFEPSYDRNASVSFYWAPMVSNITSLVNSLTQQNTGLKDIDLVVLGAGAWDALYVKVITIIRVVGIMKFL